MKILISIIGNLILTFSLSAQINLEHSFDDLTRWFNTSNGLKFIVFNQTTSQVIIYNSDYSEYKQVPLKIDTAFILGDILLPSDKLFNLDNSIEFILKLYSASSNSLKLFDESGTELKDFGINSTEASVIQDGNNYKLAIFKYSVPYGYDIYSLPGTPLTSVSQVDKQYSENPYPNPTRNNINLPYALESGQTTTMRIYNSNGQLIDQKKINSMSDKIILNVEAYKSGIYFYEYKGISHKFIVN